MKRPTMGDIAQRAGVSKATVSHVINGTRFVAEETRSRVLQAIGELDYRPSFIARSLATNRTNTVGIITPDISYMYLGETLPSIEDVLRSNDYAVFLYYTAGQEEREDLHMEMMLQNRVDGIIAVATSQKWHSFTPRMQDHTPIVFMDRSFGGLQGPYVGADNANGAYLAVQHFLECGYRDIGILAGPSDALNMAERLTGFRSAASDWGLRPPPDWVIQGPLTVEDGYRAMQHMLSLNPRPRAVLINSEQLSLGALVALREQNIRCPEDLALISFDDYPWAAVSCTPLTTVRIPNRELGFLAAKTLLTLLGGGPPPPARQTLPCELVYRRSCCIRHEREKSEGGEEQNNSQSISDSVPSLSP